MQIRFLPLALMIGAGLVLPTQTPALAKTNYKYHAKGKKYKPKKYKAHKVNRGTHKAAKAPKARH
jgi:hypothetical protein